MPLAPEYGDQVKSKIADLKNVGARPGSSITAALFLKEFVEKVGGHTSSMGLEGKSLVAFDCLCWETAVETCVW